MLTWFLLRLEVFCLLSFPPHFWKMHHFLAVPVERTKPTTLTMQFHHKFPFKKHLVDVVSPCSKSLPRAHHSNHSFSSRAPATSACFCSCRFAADAGRCSPFLVVGLISHSILYLRPSAEDLTPCTCARFHPSQNPWNNDFLSFHSIWNDVSCLALSSQTAELHAQSHSKDSKKPVKIPEV